LASVNPAICWVACEQLSLALGVRQTGVRILAAPSLSLKFGGLKRSGMPSLSEFFPSFCFGEAEHKKLVLNPRSPIYNSYNPLQYCTK
jgi:hypothetical protein